MSSSAVGTLIRIAGIVIFLLLVWLVPISLVLYIVSVTLYIPYSLELVLYSFGAVILFRAIYYRNIFV
jgi:hypothetical protein